MGESEESFLNGTVKPLLRKGRGVVNGILFKTRRCRWCNFSLCYKEFELSYVWCPQRAKKVKKYFTCDCWAKPSNKSTVNFYFFHSRM